MHLFRDSGAIHSAWARLTRLQYLPLPLLWQMLLLHALVTRLLLEAKENINHALEVARTIPGLLGVVIICGEQMGAWGEIDLVGLD